MIEEKKRIPNNLTFAGHKHKKISKEKISKGRRGKFKIKINKNEMYNLYIIQKLTAKRIARRIGCSEKCVLDTLKRDGIKVRTKSEVTRGILNPMYSKKRPDLSLYNKLHPKYGKDNPSGRQEVKEKIRRKLKEFYKHNVHVAKGKKNLGSSSYRKKYGAIINYRCMILNKNFRDTSIHL